MEIAEDGSTATRPTTIAKKYIEKKLAIEDYLDFIDDRTRDLTSSQLRQMIGMHGWFSKRGDQKSVLIDIATTMELMDLHRSTLLDGVVSDDAGFTLEEAINDLRDLDWEECHVTSLLTQGGVASAAAAADASSEGCAVSVKRKTPKTLGNKAVEVAIDDSAVSAGTTVAAGSTTVSAKRGRPKTVLKKKATEVAIDDSAVSVGTTVAAGSTTVSAKRGRGRPKTVVKKKATEVTVNDSAVSAGTTVSAGSTVSAKRGRPKKKKATEVTVNDFAVSAGTTVAEGGTTEFGVDDSGASSGTIVEAGGTTKCSMCATVPVKRKRPKGLGMKTIGVGVGTTVAAESTTGS